MVENTKNSISQRETPNLTIKSITIVLKFVYISPSYQCIVISNRMNLKKQMKQKEILNVKLLTDLKCPESLEVDLPFISISSSERDRSRSPSLSEPSLNPESLNSGSSDMLSTTLPLGDSSSDATRENVSIIKRIIFTH